MSDVYSVGILLWEISSGRPPFYTEGEKYDIGLIYEISEGLREKPVPDTSITYIRLYTGKNIINFFFFIYSKYEFNKNCS